MSCDLVGTEARLSRGLRRAASRVTSLQYTESPSELFIFFCLICIRERCCILSYFLINAHALVTPGSRDFC